MFWKKKPTVLDHQLGLLTYAGGEWASGVLQTSVGDILISIDGDQISPSHEGIEFARHVVSDPNSITALAAAFIEADARAVEFKQHGGALDLDGFSFSATPGTFTVDFGLADWPDAMLNVRFSGSVPFEVWLGD